MGILVRAQTICRRLAVVYRCNRRRGKAPVEIGLELVAKHGLPKSVYTALLKRLLSRYCLQSAGALRATLYAHDSLDGLLQRPRLWCQAFFIDPAHDEMWQVYGQRFPQRRQQVLDTAESICRHEFDLLGAHDWGSPIDWHLDPKSGHRWPKQFYAELRPLSSLATEADVKLPYELSRLQHLPTLGQAYGLTGNERYAEELVAQVEHWLDENPCLIGVNWTCAMDVAIRIVNLIWGVAFIADSVLMTPAFKQRLLASIWEHGQYVVRHLEYSIRPDATLGNHNHYLSNVVGLVYLGLLFPEFKAATRWREIGIKSLVDEMERQVHADGVDYESSLSYHRLVTELFTSAAVLCRLNGVALPSSFWAKLERMYAFTLYVTRPDGKVPQVGDADDGRLHILSCYGTWDRTDHRYLLGIGAMLFRRADMKAASSGAIEEAFWLLGDAGLETFDALSETAVTLSSRAFPEAGWYVMRASKSYVLVGCNAVNRAVAGNHKHNDLLSFELCIEATPFIVDPGAYIYTGAPEWRNCFRSTSYHNTVVIDAIEQNQFCAERLFQMEPDAEPIVHRWCSTAERDELEVEHTGYYRLLRPVSHSRTFEFDKTTTRLHIADTLQGVGEHTAEWYYHFDHGVELHRVHDTRLVAQANGLTLEIQVRADCCLTIEILDGWVSRRYGQKLPAPILKLRGTFAEQLQMTFVSTCNTFCLPQLISL